MRRGGRWSCACPEPASCAVITHAESPSAASARDVFVIVLMYFFLAASRRPIMAARPVLLFSGSPLASLDAVRERRAGNHLINPPLRLPLIPTLTHTHIGIPSSSTHHR